MPNILIVYYSRADENYVSGQLKMLKKGNTEVVAEQIADVTGGDLFKIEQKKPYAKGYNNCIEQAREDQRKNARPELKSLPESLAKYDVIFLGYPNYWGSVPMAVCTFLESFDLTGKKILPFCTHEGSGLGVSVRDIRKICPTATVADGLALHGSHIDGAENAIRKWVSEELI